MHTVSMEQAPEIAMLEQMNSEQSFLIEDAPTQEVNGEKVTPILELPLLPVRNTVIFPKAVVPLVVGREHALKAIKESFSKNRTIFLVTQLSEEMEDPGPDDLYTI